MDSRQICEQEQTNENSSDAETLWRTSETIQSTGGKKKTFRKMETNACVSIRRGKDSEKQQDGRCFRIRRFHPRLLLSPIKAFTLSRYIRIVHCVSHTQLHQLVFRFASHHDGQTLPMGSSQIARQYRRACNLGQNPFPCNLGQEPSSSFKEGKN